MAHKCEFFDKCPLTKYFGQVGWTLLARRYCIEGHYEECERRRRHLAGERVPEHLFPWDKSTK
jgi:hypothetical protein